MYIVAIVAVIILLGVYVAARRMTTGIDFVGKRRIFAVVSGLVVSLSIGVFIVIGPNWGIDFTGGSEIQLQFQDPVEIGEIREALTTLGLSEDSVQRINIADDNYEFIIRVQESTFGTEQLQSDTTRLLHERFGADWIVDSRFDAQVGARMVIEYKEPEVAMREISASLGSMEGVEVVSAPDDRTFYVKFLDTSSQVQDTIGSSLGDRSFVVRKVDVVGPKVGGDLRRQGFISMFATLALVLVYVAFRFDTTFAPGAVLALFHDVAITLGIFTLLQREVNLSMIGALLTIIGYSLNDTIVIYDRIRENMDRYRRKDMPELINVSINETLARTINTSLTTLLAIMAFLIWGGPVIETFAMAMMIGVLIGTYSTVFIASPMILVMTRIKPQLVKLMVSAGPQIDAEDDEKITV